MVAAAGARRAPPLGAQRLVAEQPLEQRAVLRGRGPRARGARGSRRARRRRGRRPAGTPRGRPPARSIALTSTCSSSRKRSTRPRTRTRSPRSKRPAEQVGVAERARLDRAGAVAQLERQVRRPDRAVRRSLREQAKTASTSSPARRVATVGVERRRTSPSMMARGRTAPTRYRGSDAAAPLGTPSRRPRAPALVCAFKGWNDAGEAATSALTFMGAGLDADALRADRPRGVRRLPVDAPERAAGRGPDAQDRVAGVRVLRGPRPARAARPDPAHRPRAGDALAHVLREGDRARRGARRPDGRHDGRAAGRRAARAPGLDHRHGLRPGADRAASLAAADLRGPDRDRRRPARRLRRRRHAVRRRCGRPCRTTSRSRRTRRARSRCCAGSRASSA